MVDVAERSSGMPGALDRLGAAVEVARLPASDYLVGESAIVERKTVLDLHGFDSHGTIPAADRVAEDELYRGRRGGAVGRAGLLRVSARALLERFGSVLAVLEASDEQLVTVPGIGPERVQALRATLHPSSTEATVGKSSATTFR